MQLENRRRKDFKFFRDDKLDLFIVASLMTNKISTG